MPKFDLHAYLGELERWSLGVHGPGDRTAEVIAHIRKELTEVKETDGADLEEWIDVIMLAANGAMRAGFSADDIARCLVDKLAKNRERRWPDWRNRTPGQPTEHIRD